MQERIIVKSALTKRWLKNNLLVDGKAEDMVVSVAIQNLKKILLNLESLQDDEALLEETINEIYSIIDEFIKAPNDASSFTAKVIYNLQADLNYVANLEKNLKAPPEMWETALNFLPVFDVLNTKLVCKTLYHCGSNFFSPLDINYEKQNLKPNIIPLPLEDTLESCVYFAVSPNNKMKAFGMGKYNGLYKLRICNTKGEELALFNTSDMCQIAFTKDNQFIISSHFEETIRVWDISEKKLAYEYSFNSEKNKGAWLHLIPLSNDHLIVATFQGPATEKPGLFLLFDLNKKEIKKDFFGENCYQKFSYLKLNKDETKLFTVNARTQGLNVYDVKSGACLNKISLDQNEEIIPYISSIEVTRDNNIIILQDKKVMLWNVETGRCETECSFPEINLRGSAMSKNYLALFGNNDEGEDIGFLLKLDQYTWQFQSVQEFKFPRDVDGMNGRLNILSFNRNALFFVGFNSMFQYQFPCKIVQVQLRENFVEECRKVPGI